MNVEELVNAVVKHTKIYDLEQTRYPGMPAFDPVQPGLLYFLYRHHESYYKPSVDGPRTSASGLILMSDQSGTHIDAKCHQASDLTFHDGKKVSPELETPWGFTALGAEEMPPLLERGVMVDVAKYVKDPLPEEHQISREEFDKARSNARVEVKRKDIVLVRTGYGKYWNQAETYKRAAGVSKEVSLWLLEQGVSAVGADNLAWDYPHYKDPTVKSNLPGHLHLLARNGIYIMENLNLEELSHDGTYEFLFVALPLKFKGATGTPMRPIAIKPT